MECFTTDFNGKASKFDFWVGGWVATIKSKHFRDFLEISWFPKFLSLKSFENS